MAMRGQRSGRLHDIDVSHLEPLIQRHSPDGRESTIGLYTHHHLKIQNPPIS